MDTDTSSGNDFRHVPVRCGRFVLDAPRPLVMGIVNVTPDSFSDGGRYDDTDAAVAHARQLLEEGADMLDIGAESTRPGAEPVAPADEIARLLPIIERLLALDVPLSIDTRHADTMRAVIAAGADMINDVNALRDPGALDAVAGSSTVGTCVMHMQGDPLNMQRAPVYRDVVSEVGEFLHDRLESLRAVGVADERIVVDPGIGFGKTLEHNLALLRATGGLAHRCGTPVLVGASRKSMIGQITGRSVGERLAGSLGVALAAAQRGARILRVHDVAATRDALLVFDAIIDPLSPRG